MKRLITLLLLLTLFPLPYYPSASTNVLVFTSPDSSFQVITSLIGNATSTIYLAVYSFSNPRLLKALNDAIARGVEVYVLLEDKHVTYFEDQYTLYAAYNLTQAGAHVHRAPKSFAYMHAKYMVVDNASVLVFTGNFAKTSVPYDPSYGNREWGIVIYDENVAKFFASVFLTDFAGGEPYDVSQGTGQSVSDYVEHGSYDHPFTPEEFSIERLEPFVLPNASVLNEYVSLIERANESVCVEIAYADFRRDSIDDVNPLIQALVEVAERGVNVRVIIGFYSDEQASLALYLRNHGIRVAWGPTEANAEYVQVDPIFAAIHTKTVIIDGYITIISSANRSENAFNNNREAGVIVRSADVAKYFEQAFDRDWEHSLIQPPIESSDYLYITIDAPTNGSVVFDNVALRVTVNSSLPGTLEVYANSSLVIEENFTAGVSTFEFRLNLSEGIRTIVVKASAGNLVERKAIVINVESASTTETSTTQEQINRMEIALVIALAVIVRLLKRKKRRFFTSACI